MGSFVTWELAKGSPIKRLQNMFWPRRTFYLSTSFRAYHGTIYPKTATKLDQHLTLVPKAISVMDFGTKVRKEGLHVLNGRRHLSSVLGRYLRQLEQQTTKQAKLAQKATKNQLFNSRGPASYVHYRNWRSSAAENEIHKT